MLASLLAPARSLWQGRPGRRGEAWDWRPVFRTRARLRL